MLLNQGFLLIELKSSLRKLDGHYHRLVNGNGISVSQMTTYICICFICRTHFPSFRRSWLIAGFVVIIIRQLSLVEQELLTLLEHMSSHPVFNEARVIQSLVVCAMFLWIVVCRFVRFLFANVSLVYGFWLPLWYLQTLPLWHVLTY